MMLAFWCQDLGAQPTTDDGLKEYKPARALLDRPGPVLLPPPWDEGTCFGSKMQSQSRPQKPLPQFSPGATHFTPANFKPFLKWLLSGQTSPEAPLNRKFSAQSFLLSGGEGSEYRGTFPHSQLRFWFPAFSGPDDSFPWFPIF